MTDKELESLREQIEEIESHGHGEVIVKVKNGYIHRVLSTKDTLVESRVLTKS